MTMPSGNSHSTKWFSFFPSVYGTFLSKVRLLDLSLAVAEGVTGMTFQRVTFSRGNSASTLMTVSVWGPKHLCASNTHIYYPYVD